VSWAAAAAVVGLGVFHGLNPAKGWLFAVALGQQHRAAPPTPLPRPAGAAGPGARQPTGPGPAAVADAPGPGPSPVAGAVAPSAAANVPGAPGVRPAGVGVAVAAGGLGAAGRPDRFAVLRALPPIAAGHLASVAAVAVAFAVTESVVASRAAAVGGGALLVGLGLWRLLSSRHFRWVGMRLSAWELGTWSFLMSSVHGAGLMLVPVLAHHSPLPASASVPTALTAATLHTAAMLGTAGAVALLVTEVLGLAVLRHAWLNVDRIWALALLAAGATTLLTT
jgi:hypothetical protein